MLRSGHAESPRQAGCTASVPVAALSSPVATAPLRTKNLGTRAASDGWRGHRGGMRHPAFLPTLAVSALAVLGLAPGEPPAAHAGAPPRGVRAVAAADGWEWPVDRFRLVAPYVQPAHRYGPGHRGLDLEPLGSTAVRAPAAGVVAFAGSVADRPIVTIDTGDGFVVTLEPVTADVAVGAFVQRGEPVGALAVGGHTAPGALHFGVRHLGEYINPLVLLASVPRAVLLPCCD